MLSDLRLLRLLSSSSEDVSLTGDLFLFVLFLLVALLDFLRLGELQNKELYI